MSGEIQVCHPLRNLDELKQILQPYLKINAQELAERLSQSVDPKKGLPLEQGSWTGCIPVEDDDAAAWRCKCSGFNTRVVPNGDVLLLQS